MSIFDYSSEDLLFAHWMRRKRAMLGENSIIPDWLEARLDQLRPLRNPNCSIFVLDTGPLYST